MRGFLNGTAPENISTMVNTFSGHINVWNSQAIHLYSDVGVTQTGLIDASTGAFIFQGGTFTPRTNGTYLAFNNAAGTQVGYVNTAATASAGVLGFNNFDASDGSHEIKLQGTDGSLRGNLAFLRPYTDAVDAFNVSNRANGHTIFDIYSSATDTNSLAAIGFGATLFGYSGSIGTGQTFSLNAATGAITATSVTAALITTPVAIASLPGSPVAGQRAAVNNADACTFGSTPVHTTGALFCPVVYDGSAWKAG